MISRTLTTKVLTVAFAFVFILTGCSDDASLTGPESSPDSDSPDAPTSNAYQTLNQDWIDSRSGNSCYYRLIISFDWATGNHGSQLVETTNTATCNGTYVLTKMRSITNYGQEFGSPTTVQGAGVGATAYFTASNVPYVEAWGRSSHIGVDCAQDYCPPDAYDWGGIWKIRAYPDGRYTKYYCDAVGTEPTNCRVLTSGSY